MAAGRPIVAPDLPDMRELLIHHENAILVKPDFPKENAAAIEGVLENCELQNKLSKNAARTSASLTWLERGRKFKEWIRGRWAASKVV